MTRDEVIRMARESGAYELMRIDGEQDSVLGFSGNESILRFANLVRQQALEDAMSVALDAVAFTGGTVDTEAHVRGAIEDLKDDL